MRQQSKVRMLLELSFLPLTGLGALRELAAVLHGAWGCADASDRCSPCPQRASPLPKETNLSAQLIKLSGWDLKVSSHRDPS